MRIPPNRISTMNEQFSVIPFAPQYRVSSAGRIQRKRDGIWTDPSTHDLRGYRRCAILVDGKYRAWLVHRLILLVFSGTPPTTRHEAMHLNGIKCDNRLENLRWGLHSENMFHDRGNNHSHHGQNNPNAKVTSKDVKMIRNAFRKRTNFFWGRRSLARKLSISEKQITLIAKNKYGGWKNVA